MRIRNLVLLTVLATLCGTPYVCGQEDVKGSQDHPLVSRMPDFYISDYQVEEFAGFEPTVIGGKDVRWEGSKFVIAYDLKEGAPAVSMLQISRNYAAAVKQEGGTILGSDERRVAAEIRKGGAMTGVYVEAFNGGRNYKLTIVESKEMPQDVTADAAAMGKDLASAGKTVIYGVYFDTGSAVIRPESEPALTEMTKLFKNNPNLKAYVIGHTDNAGTLELNLKLSGERADAVAKALVARGIPANRVKAAGVGPYCPVATNHNEPGKAQNRRVELVEQ